MKGFFQGFMTWKTRASCEMGRENCLNEFCGATTSSVWKNGWGLKSGGFATLCSDCGFAYENSVFCETFHLGSSGWRGCRICGKQLVHCGCIVSRYLYEYMDFGGILCRTCAKIQDMQAVKVPCNVNEFRPFGRGVELDKSSTTMLPINGVILALEQHKLDKSLVKHMPKNMSESRNHSSLGISSSTSSFTGSEHSKGSETNKGDGAALQRPWVARSPTEGPRRNRLLPRYQPRISDKELQQLYGDAKSTMVPLFEKVLSASDAGRVGRFILPKACAEAYFPSINLPEGILIPIQDTKGNEWTFHFRFWPNSNSRMYVLEGVTPCIQYMRLQAGDTVIFSRREPEGQLVIVCRKSTNKAEVQDSVPSSWMPCPSIGGAEDSMRHIEGKKSRNMKHKRLLIHKDDAMELRITWEEAQELLCPSPLDTKPTVLLVDGHEFEEFEEPPIFGNRQGAFISQPSSVSRSDAGFRREHVVVVNGADLVKTGRELLDLNRDPNDILLGIPVAP